MLAQLSRGALPGLTDGFQNLAEGGQPMPGLRGKVGATVEGFPLRSEEHA